MVISVGERQELLEELVTDFRGHINNFFELLDIESVRKLLDHLIANPGTMFLTGVGKSGIIARKVAMTVSSFNTKAFFLCPVDALHGDVGSISEGDNVLFFSKSGEADELLQLCPVVRNKGAHLIAIVSSSDCRLSKACDYTVILPVTRELCPFDMLPTTSTIVQHIFGDLVAIALMRTNSNFTADQFAKNHPAGRLGKRLIFTVSDLMLKGDRIPLAHTHEKLVDKLVDISNKQCGCLIVVDDHMRLIGIFTDGDLRRSLQKNNTDVIHKSIGELMTNMPKFTHPEILAFDAMKMMESDQKRPITVLPVVDKERKVVGILKMHDILQSGV